MANLLNRGGLKVRDCITSARKIEHRTFGCTDSDGNENVARDS